MSRLPCESERPIKSIPKKADKAPVTAGKTTGTTSIEDFNTEDVT